MKKKVIFFIASIFILLISSCSSTGSLIFDNSLEEIVKQESIYLLLGGILILFGPIIRKNKGVDKNAANLNKISIACVIIGILLIGFSLGSHIINSVY